MSRQNIFWLIVGFIVASALVLVMGIAVGREIARLTFGR